MNKPDKSYGEIRHEAKMEEMKKYIDPIGYAKSIAMEQIDNINNIKLLIKVYFSDDVQRDETSIGAMRRNQIRKELLQFADK
jgi:hypothetical protein